MIRFLKSKYFLVLLLLGAPFIFSGCQTANPDDSQIPWARPAGWEGGGPAALPDQGRNRY